ncbi:response regulator [Candidatus Nitrotoga sp. M5]|uniref:response regulator n=1 Tax=Candidatus Nitrotoga sp. M5 TaxID=2890409 RepID=UPI001EF1FFDE|nr:response regulator [Candidatus Nitrotoga sp. M5]CAH1385369.1 Response regulator receiver domain protein [Candidatus Nitrotoga sp. M5]
MIVYIVEDDRLKAGRLISFLAERYPDFTSKVLGSFKSGLQAVVSAPPEMLILDMTIPTYDRGSNKREGRLRPLGGYDLLRKLKLHNVSTRVIVVTQLETFGEGEEEISFSEINARCEREFSKMFIGSVYFRQSEATWQEELTKLIQMAQSSNGDQQ